MKFILFILGVILVPVALSASMSASVEKHTTIVEPKLKKLTLETNTSTLNLGEKAKLTLIATYQDSRTKPITNNIEWIVNSPNSIEINATTLTALKDGKTALQAKYENIVSNSLELDITWIVNGHTLPAEPDKTLNDSTLLGIDVNDNGVRDDVERWIYEKYKDKHPIHIDIAMQAGRAYNQLLKSPLENANQARTIHKKCVAPIACKAYYQIYAKYFNEPLLVTEDISVGYFQKFYFNIPTRRELYSKYSGLLSGDMYSTPKLGEGKNFCDFDLSKF